ncbi:hypothetical protein [Tissierella sp.]|nr:hypothetical protein [Tissierella sp.]MDR7856285.1 hypothetical protein [Tissierella sp.]
MGSRRKVTGVDLVIGLILVLIFIKFFPPIFMNIVMSLGSGFKQ